MFPARRSEVKYGIVFSAYPPGKAIINNDGTALDEPPVCRAAEIDGQQIVFMGDVLKIGELEKFPVGVYVKIIAYHGEIGNRVCLFHNEITVIRGNK